MIMITKIADVRCEQMLSFNIIHWSKVLLTFLSSRTFLSETKQISSSRVKQKKKKMHALLGIKKQEH